MEYSPRRSCEDMRSPYGGLVTMMPGLGAWVYCWKGITLRSMYFDNPALRIFFLAISMAEGLMSEP